MILAIDIGNTTVALGGLEDGRVCFVLHMDTDPALSQEQYLTKIRALLAAHDPLELEGAVLTSVVPQLTQVLAQCAAELCGGAPVIVTAESRTGLTMGVKAPEKVGRDRIVDAAYAAAHYPLPVVTVDLGTATTFSVVDEHRVFRG
ncbi:MAG: type III pantothenate kinase, partial [Oscillibacter sp.]|nr:type III pantothenate kinase [Oscillibacter sp.]